MTSSSLTTWGRVAGICLLGLVLVASSVSKIVTLPDFQETLASLGFSQGLTKPLATGIVAWELCLGTMLLLEPRKRPLLVVAICTFLAFSTVNAVTLLAGDPAGAKSCGCFGALDEKLGTTHPWSLVRSLMLAACAGLVYWSLIRTDRGAATAKTI